MIRPFKQEDRPQLISLLKLNTPDFFDPAEEKDFALYLEQHAEDYYVVEERGKIIAGGGINYGFDKGRTARLSWDLVHPGRHGSGIGSQLVRHRLEQNKKEPGVDQVVVRTTQLVWKFYEGFGFRLQKKEKDFWAPGFDLYEMKMPVRETGSGEITTKDIGK